MKKFTLSALIICVAGSLMAQKPRLVIPKGHTATITDAVFSPDGKYLLTASNDFTAKLWNREGKEVQSFQGHPTDVNTVAFSNDGKYVLTGSDDKTAKLWDLAGKQLQTFRGHSKEVVSVAFSPDGKYVLTGSNDNTAKLWNLEGQEILTLKGHTIGEWEATGVSSVAFSPDGKSMLTGGKDQTAKLWNLSGQEIQTFKGHTFWVASAVFSPDGKRIMTTGSLDGTVRIWNLAGQTIQTIKVDSCLLMSAIFSPDGKYILAGCETHGFVKLWDSAGKYLRTFNHPPFLTAAIFSPDGKFVLTAGGDNAARMWDLGGKEVKTFQGYASSVNAVAFSPANPDNPAGGSALLTGCGDNTAKLWNIPNNTIRSFKGHSEEVLSVAFSPDGKYLATAGSDTSARLWTLAGTEVQVFRGKYREFPSVAFSPDGKYVLTGSEEWENNVRLWDYSGNAIVTFGGIRTSVNAAAISPDGKYVAAGGWQSSGKLWNRAGKEIATLSSHESSISSVAFSPDGKFVLTGSEDNTAKLWDLTGKEIRHFVGHQERVTGMTVVKSSSEGVTSVAFSPDGKYVLTGSEDNMVKLWDLTGRELLTFIGHSKKVRSVTFSPNGKFVLSGSDDNTAKLWDVESGEELATLLSMNAADWVVTTPSGLFDASPGAMKMMHYVQGLTVIELEQLKERYYEPGLLAKIMGYNPGALRDVTLLDDVALYPEINARIEKTQLTVDLTERNGGLGKLSLFINGKEVQEDINPKRLKNLNLSLTTFSRYYRAGDDNTIALRAYNAEGWLPSQPFVLKYRPTAATGTGAGSKPPSKTAPKLYILAIGTADYSGSQLDLRFADQDALAMGQALHNCGSALFGAGGTFVHVLTTAAKTPEELSSKTNIAKTFAQIAAKATPADVLVVYFSGHGLAYGPAEKEQFYYLTKDIGSEDLGDPGVRDNYTVSSNELTQWLTAIPAQKQVMILDACNAGKVVESLVAVQKELSPSQIRALDRMKDRTGMFILTGSAADKASYEASQYGQGLLTYSLLHGMSGLALTEDKRVDVMTLFQYARDQVPELAKGIGGIQTPVLAFPAGGASFDIGMVTTKVKIPVVQVKPVFIRNNFQNEDTFDDGIGLTDALEVYFRRITAKGAEAEIIFVDVKEYENAYSMKGLYTVRDDVVTVRGRLFQGAAPKGEFQVTGKKSDVPGLAAAVVEKVVQLIK